MSAMPTLIESLVTPCVAVELLARLVAPNVSAANSNVTMQTANVDRRVVVVVLAVPVVPIAIPPVRCWARQYDGGEDLSRQAGIHSAGGLVRPVLCWGRPGR